MMGKPPKWLLWLGPPMAGFSAGFSNAKLEDASFWVLFGLALAFGLIPSLIYLIWQSASKKNR